MKRLIVAVVGLMFFSACSSKQVSTDEPPKFDKALNTATPDRAEKVGIKDNTIMIQKRVYLEEELNKISSAITDLENNIYGRSKKDPGGLWASLNKCRKRCADPRIGGDGNVEPMEKWEKPSEAEESFTYAVDSKNNVVAVSDETLEARMANLTKTKHILDQRFDDFKEKVDVCDSKYRTALIQHGLDPRDTQAIGEWSGGNWVMRRSASDDPEELMRRKKEREAAGK